MSFTMESTRIGTTSILLILIAEAAAAAGSAEGMANSPPDPNLVLSHHFAVQPADQVWSAETVEIEAAIPKLAQHGRLRAIRRLLPIGRPEYQVLALDGDRTVRQQVIARYVSADVQAAALSPASVAITPANYRFRYQGSISDGKSLAYIFEISPRKKRAGLIRGQLWIDTASGLAVRQTGYLVRSLSMFIRRVNLTRDTALRDGVAYAKTTRIEIDTRLVGRAELTITERPYSLTAGETTGEGTR